MSTGMRKGIGTMSMGVRTRTMSVGARMMGDGKENAACVAQCPAIGSSLADTAKKASLGVNAIQKSTKVATIGIRKANNGMTAKKKQRDKDDKKKYKGSHHENKDIDIGLVMGLFAGGTVAGGVMVAVICFACQRKRVWVAAPPVTGTSVFDRPAMDDVNQTHVVVGTTVEKGQVPIAQERANAKANVIADLECGAGNQSAI